MRRTMGSVLAAAAMAWMASVSPLCGQELARSPNRLESTTVPPKAYGTQDYTVTVVPAIAFYPRSSAYSYYTGGGANSLTRYGDFGTLVDFYAPIDLPPGAQVDYIGLNSKTDTTNAIGVELLRRHTGSSVNTVGSLNSTVHDWATDYNSGPLGVVLLDPLAANVLHVQQGNVPTTQYFGFVEVWWKRTVSNPTTVTFNDVPSNHPFFQFVEALAASGITAGCGGGNFCPDNPLTRGQMAAFLSKALGLHWGSQP